MFGRILVPLDGSAYAESSLSMAAHIGRAYQAELILFQVADARPWARDDLLQIGTKTTATPTARAERYLRAVRQHPALDGLPIFCSVSRPSQFHPSQDLIAGSIISEAKQVGADLVVMTTHGHSGPDHWLLGSVAFRVMKQIPRNLLFVPPAGDREESATRDWSAEPTRVVIALDGSQWGEEALRVGANFASRVGGEVALLSVIPSAGLAASLRSYPGNPPAGGARPAAGIEQYLADSAAGLLAQGISSSWEVRTGPAGRAITEAVHNDQRSLLVLNARSRPTVTEQRLGSVAYELVRRARVPVLTVERGQLPRSTVSSSTFASGQYGAGRAP